MNANSLLKPYLQPAFIICTAILALAAAGLSFAEHTFGFYLKKEPIPLKKSLDSLDEVISPYYKIVQKETISEEILATLGTNNYIQWTIEDTNEPLNSAVRFCNLFITYYDITDNIPHRPEECYIGGGNVPAGSEDETITLKRGDIDEPVPLKYLTFKNVGNDLPLNVSFSLCYLIYSNEKYTNREGARFGLKNIFSKYSYFSKVEWKFYSSNQFSMTAYPDRKECLQASEKLLSVILPALEKDIWPDSQNIKSVSP